MSDDVQIVQETDGRWALIDSRTHQPIVMDGRVQSNLTLQRVARAEHRLIQQDRMRASRPSLDSTP